ncbi:lipase [Shewanella hanedai]|uniref:SGNH/GDSL hydrolase family protein n=1 Tax=Shewanella hanedai TaxID=25 RepID=A0A553JPD9_SHEHA|nr:SGNH/GDSL hydrolase family protein [Shewanella hanedai]TRY14313.1 SGNH/GDSL hydrolase family protein [Shewanella hanedai]GGI81131.1 lipase [Shewanella hanedai]
MFRYMVLVCLAPLLALQGLYVRRISLVLPEANGERCGTLGEGAALSLLVAGDSAAAGVGVDHQDQALVGYITQELAKQYCVTWSLVAQSGNTTTDLIEKLTKIEGKQFDVVLLSIGVNDVLSPLRSQQWQEQLQLLTQQLQSQFHTKRIWFTSVPPMENFPLLPHPLRWFLGQRAQAFNRSLEEFVGLNKACGLINLSGALHQDDDLQKAGMAKDGFHPSEPLYKVWGVAAASMIMKQLD